MKTKLVYVIGVAAIAVFAICLVIHFLSPADLPELGQPSYQGRSLSQWISVYSSGFAGRSPATEAEKEAARKAIRMMGTNAIPTLLGWVQIQKAPPLPLKERVKLFFTHLSPTYGELYVAWHQRAAQEGFRILKQEAQAAVPALLQLINEHKDKAVREEAFRCLRAIHPDKEIYVSALIPLVRNPDKYISYYAAEELNILDAEAAEKAGVYDLFPIYREWREAELTNTLSPARTNESPASAQDNDSNLNTEAKPAMLQRHWTPQEVLFSPGAYGKEALRLVIEEANRVAQELHLAETLPITETNVLSAYITPPRMAQAMKAIGNVTTSNYTYYISVGKKFSFLQRTHMDREYDQLREQYLWPMSRKDTNAAYQMAKQFLAAASMDVAAMDRDCRLDIKAFIPEGPEGEHFVPLYWVVWMKNQRPAAIIELFEPTKTLCQMRVKESKYILRKPLEITNLDFLLSQTNAPATTNAPIKQ
jgi:hypothetical protein